MPANLLLILRRLDVNLPGDLYGECPYIGLIFLVLLYYMINKNNYDFYTFLRELYIYINIFL